MRIKLSILALIVSGVSALAQETPQDSTKTNALSEVVVTGQFEPQSIKKSVFNVRVITQKDIKQLAANNLADVLNQYLNIIVQPSGSDGRSTVSLFGLDGQYFKILVDNVPLVSDNGLGNNIDLTQINLNDVERIEIIEGSMGVTHGANAVSGVLNIITKKASSQKWELSALLQEETVGDEYSWFKKGRHIQGLKVGHTFKNWYVSVGSNRNDFTGYLGDKNGKDYTVNDGTRGYSWLPKEQWVTNTMLSYWRNDFRFFYKFEYMNETVDHYNQTVYSVSNPPFGETRRADDSHYYTTRFYHHANATGKLFKQLQYNVSVSHQMQKREEENLKYNLNTHTEENKDRDKDQSSEVLYSTGTISNFFTDKKFDMQFGYEAVNENGFSRVIAENNFLKEVRKRVENYDFFLSGELNVTSKFSIRPGVRYSLQSLFENQYAASLAFKYLLKEDLELRASFGRSYRTPNFEELYSEIIFSGHYFVGNDKLIPETSTSYEASIKKATVFSESAKLSSNLTVNFLDVNDRISMALVELTPIAKSQYINISKYQMWNAAFTNQFSYKEFSFNTGVSLVGISQQINNLEAVSSDKFLYTLQFNSSISYSVPKWKSVFSLYYKYNGKQQQYTGSFDEEGKPTFRLSAISPFSWMDASAKKTFYKDRFEVTLGARNLLNITNVQQTQANAGAAHPTSGNVLLGYGRSYFLKLMYNLNF